MIIIILILIIIIIIIILIIIITVHTNIGPFDVATREPLNTVVVGELHTYDSRHNMCMHLFSRHVAFKNRGVSPVHLSRWFNELKGCVGSLVSLFC